jgi:hypothetical protein
VIIQFAKGDQTDSNPTATALLRAGNLADRATYYRYDLAFPQYQQDPNNPLAKMSYPHGFAAFITSADQTVKKVALAAQNQVATFIASEGTQIIQPQPPDGFGFGLIPEKYFEVPIKGTLPEGLNYINPPVSAATASGGSTGGSILLNAGVRDESGSIEVQPTDLPTALLALAIPPTLIWDASAVGRFSAAPSDDLALTTPVDQGQQYRLVSDRQEAGMDGALTAGTRPVLSSGSDLFDVAALDVVFADSATSLDRDARRLSG